MTPRKSKRKTSSRWFARVFFFTTFLLILIGLGVLYQDRLFDLAMSSRGDQYPQDRGLIPAEKLEEAIILGARELGVPHKRIGRQASEGGIPEYEFRCPNRLHPITANRWLSRIFLDSGVEILDCLEEGKLHRPKLIYHLATGPAREARARVIVYPPTGGAPLAGAMPRLAIIIDDFGYSMSRVPRGLLNLGCPITASILPGLRHSKRAEREAHRNGHTVFLHQPMEPMGYPDSNPGPGALFTDMDADSITRVIEANARDFQHLAGVNNHMGSRGSADEDTVRPVLDWAIRRDLIVVDSFTTPRSLIYPLARQMNIPVLRTDFFLDGEEENEAEIMENIAVAAETARKRGWALVIGHPRAETLSALQKMMPRLRDYGIRFVTVQELLDSLREADPAPPASSATSYR
ncbi:MAG: divergent polysaccharide deacetylase family protein [bacterium]|nr:divergent polysaccharide deacetylase family protein [bacterium]